MPIHEKKPSISGEDRTHPRPPDQWPTTEPMTKRRDDDEDVGDAHQDRVDDAAEVPGDRSDDDAHAHSR